MDLSQAQWRMASAMRQLPTKEQHGNHFGRYQFVLLGDGKHMCVSMQLVRMTQWVRVTVVTWIASPTPLHAVQSKVAAGPGRPQGLCHRVASHTVADTEILKISWAEDNVSAPRHLSQMHTTNYMPFYGKRRLIEKKCWASGGAAALTPVFVFR